MYEKKKKQLLFIIIYNLYIGHTNQLLYDYSIPTLYDVLFTIVYQKPKLPMHNYCPLYM